VAAKGTMSSTLRLQCVSARQEAGFGEALAAELPSTASADISGATLATFTMCPLCTCTATALAVTAFGAGFRRPCPSWPGPSRILAQFSPTVSSGSTLTPGSERDFLALISLGLLAFVNDEQPVHHIGRHEQAGCDVLAQLGVRYPPPRQLHPDTLNAFGHQEQLLAQDQFQSHHHAHLVGLDLNALDDHPALSEYQFVEALLHAGGIEGGVDRLVGLVPLVHLVDEGPVGALMRTIA